MRPILLKGHERSITCVIYNNDGDLIFTAAKDQIPTLWFADTGERCGTYNGHNGAVWDMDVSWDSTRLLTASADATCRLWEVETGKDLVTYHHKGPVRSVCWAEGAERFATVSDPFMDRPGSINIFSTPNGAIPSEYNTEALREIELPPKVKATRCAWSSANERIIVAFESGVIKSFDPETGEELQHEAIHNGSINRISLNKDKTLLLTASKDYASKLLDAHTFEVLKTFTTERPVNAACFHPTKPHMLMGGGQDAMTVTTTSGRVGKFETRFYNMIYEEEFGRVKGHFGPINAIAVCPNGTSYCSGAEDGYIRLHHFDKDYIDMTDEVPDDFEEGVDYEGLDKEE